MKQKFKHNLLLVGIAVLIIILDQVIKALVRQNLVLGETWMPLEWLAPFARFIFWQNTGAAFGIFQSGNMILKILMSIIAVIIVIYYQQVPPSEKLVQVALSMQLGGAIGNLIDRFTRGYVTDFISVGNFPVFNVADSSVTIGVGLLILAMLLQEKRERKATQTGEVSLDVVSEPEEKNPKP